MTKRHAVTSLIVLCGFVLACACSSKPQAEKRYHLEGKVVSIDKRQHQVTIHNQDIPGFMTAMTMPYSVPKDADFNKLSVGDSITAAIIVTDAKTWVEDVHVVGHGAP